LPYPEGVDINFELKRARLMAGLSQVDLARLSGISRFYLCRIERGRVRPGPRARRKIAESLGWGISSLFSHKAEESK